MSVVDLRFSVIFWNAFRKMIGRSKVRSSLPICCATLCLLSGIVHMCRNYSKKLPNMPQFVSFKCISGKIKNNDHRLIQSSITSRLSSGPYVIEFPERSNLLYTFQSELVPENIPLLIGTAWPVDQFHCIPDQYHTGSNIPRFRLKTFFD